MAYNRFLGAFFSGDDGNAGYNQAYKKSTLAKLYQTEDPEARKPYLADLARLDPDTAADIYATDQKAVQAKLEQQARMLASLPTPQHRQQMYASMLPEIRKSWAEAPEQYTPELDSALSAWAGGGVQEKYTGAPFVVMKDGKPEYYRYGPNGVEATGLTAPDQFQMIQGPDGYYRVPTKREGDASQVNVTTNNPPVGSAPPLPQGDITGVFKGLAAKYGGQITSLGRSPEHNRKVGGVANSFHLTGQAADVVVPPNAKQAFIVEAKANGFDAIDEGDHIHLEPASRGGATQLQGPPKEPKTAIAYDANGNAFVADVSTPGPIAGAVRPGSQLSAKDKQKIEAMKRKEYNLVNSNAAKINETVRIIDNLINSNALGGVTGVGAFASNIPGTKWADAAAQLETLRAKSAFGALSEMRANSPTGGALGSVTERELSLLQNAETQLSQAQSPEAFKQALVEYKRILLESQKRMVDGVQEFYESSPTPQSSSAGKYKIGQVIQSGGKRYRVTGGDMNDPDVEEIP